MWGFAWGSMNQFRASQWDHLPELEKQDKLQKAPSLAEAKRSVEIRDVSEWEADKSYLVHGKVTENPEEILATMWEQSNKTEDLRRFKHTTCPPVKTEKFWSYIA